MGLFPRSWELTLLACIDELNAIALITECAREIVFSCPRLSEMEFGVLLAAVAQFQHENIRQVPFRALLVSQT